MNLKGENVTPKDKTWKTLSNSDFFFFFNPYLITNSPRNFLERKKRDRKNLANVLQLCYEKLYLYIFKKSNI